MGAAFAITEVNRAFLLMEFQGETSILSKEVEIYAKDKLVHGKITVGMFLDVVDSGIWAIQNARKLKNV